MPKKKSKRGQSMTFHGAYKKKGIIPLTPGETEKR